MQSPSPNYLLDISLPVAPVDEISRDAAVRKLTESFDPQCQKQLVVGARQVGKTNLLTQFVRYHTGNVVAYFISSSPLTQRKHIFLYELCLQLSVVLGKTPPSESITTPVLEALFSAQLSSLTREVNRRRNPFYIVIDGLEWGIEGHEGERIIDLFPLDTKSRGPYLLASCRVDCLSHLPEEMKRTTRDVMPFSIHETRAYLADSGFRDEDVQEVHRKSNGVPGYLKIIKTTKTANPSATLLLPPELTKLIEQQLNLTLSIVDASTKKALDLLASVPAPLDLNILSALTASVKDNLITNLNATGLVRWLASTSQFEFANDLLREEYLKRIKNEIPEYLTHLKQYLEVERAVTDPLLDLLYRELNDYSGIQKQVSLSAIVTTITQTGDISRIAQRLRTLAYTAYEQHNITDLLRWTMLMATMKSIIDYNIDQDEIRALLAIGEDAEALSKAYAVPELSSQVRLLAEAYKCKKDRGDRISSQEKSELIDIVQRLPVERTDRDIVQRVALDILPILPDIAITLLEQISVNRERDNIVDVAEAEIQLSFEEEVKKSQSPRSLREMFSMLPNWLTDRSLRSVLDEIKPQTTKSKELIIRQWCRQNIGSEDMVAAVNLWIDVVEDDRDFVIVLRSLRDVSEAILDVHINQRLPLIERLRVPRYTAIEAPREEWIRVRLNLAEAIHSIQPVQAMHEIEEIHRDILYHINDLDEQAFCLAQLQLTLKRLGLTGQLFMMGVKDEFDNVFSRLLQDSAEHLDTMRKTIRTLVAIDPEEASIVASQLNTRSRRVAAYQIVLKTIFSKFSNQNRSRLIDDILKEIYQISEPQCEACLITIAAESCHRGRKISSDNLDVLTSYTTKIRTRSSKATILVQLAVLYHDTNPDISEIVLTKAIDEWRLEADLLGKIGSGYALVEFIAKVNFDRAKELYREVQQLRLQPSAVLATGRSAAVFSEALRLAIRALTIKDFHGNAPTVRQLQQMIDRVPAITVRIELLTRLAANAYCIGATVQANDIVRTLILRKIRRLSDSTDRDTCIQYAMPVIYTYDPHEAEQLSHCLSISLLNTTYFGVLVFLLSKQVFALEDLQGDPADARFVVSRPELQKAVDVLRYITYDYLLYTGVLQIAKAAESSFLSDKVDTTQALDILALLTNIAHDRNRLPDPENISHDGYAILAESAVLASRCAIWLAIKKHKRRGYVTFDQKSLDSEWQKLVVRARAIPNAADRILVMSLMARDCGAYYAERDIIQVRTLLEQAYDEIGNIPTMVDRLERLEWIADSWRRIGQANDAKHVLQSVFKEISGFYGIGYEERLTHATQLAYKVSPEFAEELLNRFDSRRTEIPIVRPPEIAMYVERLLQNPACVKDLSLPNQISNEILHESAQGLVSEYILGRGVVQGIKITLDWLTKSLSGSTDTITQVATYAIESLIRKRSASIAYEHTQTMLDVAEFTYMLAQAWSDRRIMSGLSSDVQESFAGLSTKYEVFQTGEQARAHQWLETWLSDNATGYLYICDPYFEPEHILFLRYVPPECRVMIVTTDTNMPINNHTEGLQRILELHWKQHTSLAVPTVSFLIVSNKLSDQFHDRAILTQGAGLDIGQSLNGLGSKLGKIRILNKEESEELRQKYLTTLLNNGNWFMEHGISPISFMLGKQSSNW